MPNTAVITPEMAARLRERLMQAGMTGSRSDLAQFEDQIVPGAPLMPLLVQLGFTNDNELGRQLASQAGISPEAYQAEIKRANEMGQARRGTPGGPLGKALSGVTDAIQWGEGEGLKGWLNSAGRLAGLVMGAAAAGGGLGGAGSATGSGGATKAATFGAEAAAPASGATTFGAPTAAEVIASGAFGPAPAGVSAGVLGGSAAAPAAAAGPLAKFAEVIGFGKDVPKWQKILKGVGMGTGALAAMNPPAPAQGTPVQTDTRPLLDLDYGRSVSTPNDYYRYGETGGEHQFFTPNAIPSTEKRPQEIRQPGGPPGKWMAEGGQFVRGPGSGREDKISALLSDGEYVIDAETVALLGDGSVDEGSRRLDAMRKNIRQHKGKALAQGRFSPNAKDPEKYIGKPGFAKGGSIRRIITGGKGQRGSRPDRQAMLDTVKRFEGAYRQSAVNNLEALAEEFQRLLSGPGNEARIRQIERQLEGAQPGLVKHLRGMSKGGSIRSILSKLRGEENILDELKGEYQRRQSTDLEELARILREMDPDSPILGMYEADKRLQRGQHLRRPLDERP